MDAPPARTGQMAMRLPDSAPESMSGSERPRSRDRWVGAFVYLCFIGVPYPLIPLGIIFRRNQNIANHIVAGLAVFACFSLAAALGALPLMLLDPASDAPGVLLGLLLLPYVGVYVVMAIRAATGWVPFSGE